MAVRGKNVEHPFASQEPKPTRARLVSLLDPLGRRRYAEVERFLATIQGSTSGLHYYNTDWGWAVRYMIGSKEELCTLHLLPDVFESTVKIHNALDMKSKGADLSSDFRRRISRTKVAGGQRPVRMPLKNDNDYENFQKLIKIKAEFVRDGGAKPKAKAEKAEKPAKAAKAGKPAKAEKKAPVKKAAKKAVKKTAKKPAKKVAKKVAKKATKAKKKVTRKR